jgi:DUF1680 family protein
MDRRRFLEVTIASGATATASRIFGRRTQSAIARETIPTPRYEIADWIAATPATFYRPYRSLPAKDPSAVSWIQVDLGSIEAMDAVRLYPSSGRDHGWPHPYDFGTFPVRFKIETCDQQDFLDASLIADCTAFDSPDPKDQITEYPAKGKRGRYVRLTVTQMRAIPETSVYGFEVSKLAVLSAGKDLAEGCQTAADPVYGNNNDLLQITRVPRPMGEGVVTDHPENVTQASTWKPVQYQAFAPRSGVTLEGGLFQTVLERNIGYLLDSFTVEELLRQFRERAGKSNPPNLRAPDPFWEEDLAGSNAGRFLMGAGNTLRWVDHSELRRRLNAIVDGIDDCKQSNGYIMAYPEDSIFYSERAAYTRAWVTHGLIEAGYCGNPKAFALLRGYYDWFDRCPYLPELLRRAGLGPQGMIANTRVYFTPVGKPEDIQVIQRYFQENYWLEDLANHKEEAIWQYPYDRPHCYEITFLEAYFDLYRATGDRRYLDAMIGAWDLYHDEWENVGGSMSIEEFVEDPPGSYRLNGEYGELDGSAFWILFNQRFQLLYPHEEKYVAEIEKSIYNVGIANQDGTRGIRYFTYLLGQKDKSTRQNTCCEGQGTRLLGSLPEHIYSVASDGIYVNLFEPSILSWSQKEKSLRLKMSTDFPFRSDVQLKISVDQHIDAKIRVRVPSWSSSEMPLMINGKLEAAGTPGTYVTFDRTWADGDTISFTLATKLMLTPYTGSDNTSGKNRYALEYGPILLAAVGSKDITLKVNGSLPGDLLSQIAPVRNSPLHFTIEQNEGVKFMPYWQVSDEKFTCFHELEFQAGKPEENS